MTKYAHKIKEIPAYDTGTVPAPAALGQPRGVSWDPLDPACGVRPIAYINLATQLTFYANDASWPRAGGRAVIVSYSQASGMECWTADQLEANVVGRGIDPALAAKAVRRVWASRVRTDPWPKAIQYAFEIK